MFSYRIGESSHLFGTSHGAHIAMDVTIGQMTNNKHAEMKVEFAQRNETKFRPSQ